MPRLNPPDPSRLPAETAEFLATLPPDPMFATLGHAVTTIKPLLALAETLYTGLELPARTRELGILTIADRLGSEFVWAQHVPISEAAGVTEHDRELIARGDREPRPPGDRAVVEFAAAVATGAAVGDELFESVRQVLTDREIVELFQVLGYYWTLARVSTVLDISVTQLYADEYGARWPAS